MDIFDKLSQPECAGINMICVVPHVDSYVLDLVRLSQWSYSCLLKALQLQIGLHGSKDELSLLKGKDYSLKLSFEMNRGLQNMDFYFCHFCLGIFKMITSRVLIILGLSKVQFTLSSSDLASKFSMLFLYLFPCSSFFFLCSPFVLVALIISFSFISY